MLDVQGESTGHVRAMTGDSQYDSDCLLNHLVIWTLDSFLVVGIFFLNQGILSSFELFSLKGLSWF